MRGRYGRALRKLLRLSPREWRNLLRAQWALLAAERAVRTLPTGALTAGAADPGETVSGGDPAAIDAARELALAVSRAAHFGVTRPLCLVRAMALSRLMERDGITGGVVRVGVRRRQERVEAHAWVEFAGEVLGDHEDHVDTFAELPSLRVLDRR